MSRFIVNEGGIHALMRSRNGAVARDLYRRGLRVQAKARQDCPVGTPESTGKKGYVGGTLRQSIALELGVDAQGVFVRIGSNVYYAEWVHDGTSKMAGRPFLLNALSAAR